MRPDSPMLNFDPRRLAHLEKESYVAYYKKDWLKLLRVSVSLVKEAFGLSWWQAVRAAYFIARAQIAFAPFPANDVPTAEAYTQRFYQLLKDIHHEQFDVDRAARLEVGWWIIHRKLFAQPENDELVEALTAIYAEAYSLDPEKVRPAASLRAMGMFYSDLWVNGGKHKDSKLLDQEEEALYRSYELLKQVIKSAGEKTSTPHPATIPSISEL